MELVSDLELLVVGSVILALVYAMAELRRRSRGTASKVVRKRRRSKRSRPKRRKNSKPVVKGKPIVVDGSNVMYWGGDDPSDKVLRAVLSSLTARGFYPFVIFDASVGYRLADRYLDAAAMSQRCGVPKTRIEVVDKGVVADGVILKYAKRHGVKVVSNDRYRDWSVQYPLVKQKGRMMRGAWKGGAVVWGKS